MARERWDKRSAFILAAIGSAIGLGNVWRFPYMAYSNGGGAFFIPYIIALLTTGVPLLALEYYLGIRHQKGPTEAYGKIRKNTNYIGWFALFVSSMIVIYYTVIMGWAWNYIYHAFGVDWAGIEKKFFYENILSLSKGVGHMGGIVWPIVIGNALTWLCIYLIIFKGVKVVGKIVSWTVGIPWLLLGILVIRGVTLNGAANGLAYYLDPDFSQLANPDVWLGAYGQIFFSLSLGFGIMIAYASYLPKDSDVNTNAWVVSFANCATSFFAGFAIFSVLGYLAVSTNTPVSEVAKAGPGLAFIIYPKAISLLPGGIVIQSIFGISFFLMLLLLGIDSAFSLVEGVVTSFKDSFNWGRERVTLVVCIIGFLLGFIYSTQAGLYWLDIVDHWMNWGLVIVGLMEAILIGWFYNIEEVAKDIDSTSEFKFGKYWIFCIKYITPTVLFITITSSIYKEFHTPYEGYPKWALMTGGWILLLVILFAAIVLQYRNNLAGNIKKIICWAITFILIIITCNYTYLNSTGPFIMGLLMFIILFGGTVWGVNKMKKA